ncbi:MAG: HAD-IA family hydrolase [Candidatus Micrarchaeia archaeon]
MPIKAVLFDLDNTLTDFIKMKREASRAAARAMVACGLAMPPEEAERELFKTYWEHGIDSNTAFREFLKKHTGKVDESVLGCAIGAYLKVKAQHLVTYPNIVETLERLKARGMRLGVVTDAPREKALQRLHALGVERLFDTVIAFEETNRHKPHELPFKKACEKLGVVPAEVLMVGDSPERDILGAQRLGMRTALAKYGEDAEVKWRTPEGIRADYEIKDPLELLRIVA